MRGREDRRPPRGRHGPQTLARRGRPGRQGATRPQVPCAVSSTSSCHGRALTLRDRTYSPSRMVPDWGRRDPDGSHLRREWVWRPQGRQGRLVPDGRDGPRAFGPLQSASGAGEESADLAPIRGPALSRTARRARSQRRRYPRLLLYVPLSSSPPRARTDESCVRPARTAHRQPLCD